MKGGWAWVKNLENHVNFIIARSLNVIAKPKYIASQPPQTKKKKEPLVLSNGEIQLIGDILR